ncbi:DUF943 family protein [Enterobacter cloacae]|uniref:Enterobacterial putative membrane protein (DUF943) n=1 Tax=Enterobacter cloacae TaxID=550 RepID=A0A157I2S9_ENTCL|nr:DUF943 family protein [Enterobacter cloacae]CZW13740.1 Enterobacterial putative membrane protein (DUF943) [Enterobacter cloacae]SAH54298.1 Enterobacterial putative membrane protein (DUF943) [Enterobacter cloacae]
MNKRLTGGVVAVAVCSYLLWQFFTPVEIVAVHDGNTILVRHFPYLKSRQITWWETNKDQIQAKYGIPCRGEDDYYSVVIMDFGEGYRIDRGTDEDSDLLCFDDISVNKRCIKKKPRLWIRFSENTGLFYR